MIEKITRLKVDTEGIPYQYRDNTDNDMAMIVYLPDSPVIEGEDNYQQQLTAMQLRRMVRSIIGKSTLLSPITPTATGNANEIRLHTINQPFHAALDGIVKTVYAYDTPTFGAATEGGNRVTLPAFDVAGRQDLVYLEIWFTEVMAVDAPGTADKTIYRHGMEHGFTDVNNIKVESYTEIHETARRVQLRGKIRTASGTASLTGRTAKGSASYTYTERDGVFMAGAGDIPSAQNLDTVDGYVYAIPLVVVTRGSNAETMTDIEVVAPYTATLQQLANSTLKDVSQFGTDISNLYNATTSNTNLLTALRTEKDQLQQTVNSLSSSLSSANEKATALEKTLYAERNTIRFISRDYTDRDDATDTFSTFHMGSQLYYIPANQRLAIKRVHAHLPTDAATLTLIMYGASTTVRRQWTWAPGLVTPRGGTYSFNGPFLIRDGDANIIDLPDFDRTSEQYVLVYANITVPTPLNISRFSGADCDITITMTPK